MIARQRQNLALTFAAQSEEPVSAKLLQRLTNYENEIAAATQELIDGLAQRGQFTPELDSALSAMQNAVGELRGSRLPPAVATEQLALQNLLKARQNLRKMLTPPNSSSASNCRQFDRQQRQKLRTPEQVETDRQQQLAETRQQLDQLAQNQRQWSEELRNSSQSSAQQQQQQQQKPTDSKQESQSQSQSKSQSQSTSQSQSQSSSQSESQSESQSASQSPRTAAELAEAQRQMLAALEKLRQRLAEQQGSTPASEQTAELAAESMQRGLEELQGQQSPAASEAGHDAAEQLDALSDHLANLNARDFGERLERTQQMAERLAGQQQQVADQVAGATRPDEQGSSSGADNKSSTDQRSAAQLARRERELSAEAQRLHELLAGLRADSAGEKAGVKGDLDDAVRENSPAEIAERMQEAAAGLDRRQGKAAQAAADAAAQQLRELAGGLKGIRGRFSQPQLEELLELEKQVAQLQQQLQRGVRDGQLPQLGEQWENLEPRLDELASGDRRLAQALDQMRNPAEVPAANHNGRPSETPPGLYWMRLGGNSPLRDVGKALQVKIQEAILAAALQDADEPVPPEYKQLVEEYYRALSDDLR